MPTRVLIIDDEVGMRHVFSMILKKKGYATDTAADVPTALQKARNNPPDIFCVDLMMPEINGLEFLKQRRESPTLQQIPAIVITASGEQRMINQALELGAEVYLAKPLSSLYLIETIERLLTDTNTETHGST